MSYHISIIKCNLLQYTYHPVLLSYVTFFVIYITLYMRIHSLADFSDTATICIRLLTRC